MIIQYILNLQKAKSYTGSGSFELFGSALSQEAFRYAAGGVFELFGSAEAFILGGKYTGAGSFSLLGSASVSLPLNLANIKFSIKDFGYGLDNQQYTISEINSQASTPIYIASKLGKNYRFTNDTLLTPPEIQAYNNTKYKISADNIQQKINSINSRLTNLIPPVNTSYNTKINFTIKQYFKDDLLKNKKVDEILGESDAVFYKTGNQLFSQNEIYDPAFGQIAYKDKIDKLLDTYNNKINQISQKLTNVDPVAVTDSLLAIKFTTNQFGKNISEFNQKVIQIYGVNDNIIYRTQQADVPSDQFLIPNEVQAQNKQKYEDQINSINQKLAQINDKLYN
jgi:hypothetical protein